MSGVILIDNESIVMDGAGRVGRPFDNGYQFTENSLLDELTKRYAEIVNGEFSEWMAEVAP